MSSLLKDMYSPEFYDRFAILLGQIIPAFDEVRFKGLIFNEGWEKKELKDRMKHTAVVLHEFMPSDFSEACRMIIEMIGRLRKNPISKTGFEFMFFPDYIERYGLNEYETAVGAMEIVTQFTSCEFAVRPFILKYEADMLVQMIKWSKHKSADVRRLSSEGCRPRLPWAIALPSFKKNPELILPILENLKSDSSEMVRRSVANNLNDIAKDNPDVVIGIVRKWKGVNGETDALVKHACRTLFKQGHPEILSLYGLEATHVEFSDFSVLSKSVEWEGDLSFSFALQNKSVEPLLVRLEYAIFFRCKNGTFSKKVFKVSEKIYQPGEQNIVVRKHRFQKITTRKYYPGEHGVSVIINGQEITRGNFVLEDEKTFCPECGF